MRRRLLGEEHPQTAISLSNLATHLRDKGDYAAAEPLFREALAMRRRLLGNEHPYVARTLSELGVLLRSRGQYSEAEPIVREALAIRRAALGNEHNDTAESTHELAVLREASGDRAGADSLYRQALAVRRKLLGEKHARVGQSLSFLARLRQTEGDYAGAEQLQREALVIWREALGAEHPNVASGLITLAALLNSEGRYADAESVLTEAASTFEVARVRAGTNLARATFSRSPYPSLAVTRLAVGKTDEAWLAAERHLSRVLADVLLAAGGRSLTLSERAREDSLRLLMGQLERQVQTYLTAATSDTSRNADIRAEEARTRLFSAEAEWSALRRDLAARYPVTEGQAYAVERVQGVLSTDEAIVGWLDADSLQAQAGLSSWGYVIREEGAVRWHRLPEHTSAITLASADRAQFSPESFRRALAHGLSSDEPQATGAAIGEWIWRDRFEPIEDDLAGVHHLIVIPSGRMLGVPVEAIIEPASGVRVGDRFAVSYTPSATIFAWLSERSGSAPRHLSSGRAEKDRSVRRMVRTGVGPVRCLALGDPPYSAADDSAADCEELSLLASGTLGERSPFRGVGGAVEADNVTQSALAGNPQILADLRRLPCTRGEAEAVGGFFGEKATVLVGARASEQEMVRMAASGQLADYRVLHLATHALVDDERPERSALVLSQVGLPDQLQAALAGTRIYDGCISAQEVVREWDLDADLVTLSACQTGLGKRVGGEGYIGLAHAFLQAGARSLLVSLWSVEDRSTSLLMKRFYENWLGNYEGVREMPGGEQRDPSAAMTKADALQEAKHWLREYVAPDGTRPYADAAYWAGFILIGQAH